MSDPRKEAQKDAMFDYMMEQKNRAEELDKKGLCHDCADNPQNPAINPKVCLQCFNRSEFSCGRDGCPNGIAGPWEQGGFCEKHLIEVIHEKYEDYISLKSKIQDMEEDLKELEEELGYNPLESDKRPSDYSDRDKEFEEMKVHIQEAKRELSWLKGNLDRAIDSVEQAFPENFSANI